MPNEKFDLTIANENISALCDYIEQVNKPNPLNPVGLSDMAYHGIMTGLHGDPCGGRDCDTCEIGGCDHGIESELNPELRARMEQNSDENKREHERKV